MQKPDPQQAPEGRTLFMKCVVLNSSAIHLALVTYGEVPDFTLCGEKILRSTTREIIPALTCPDCQRKSMKVALSGLQYPKE